MSGNREHTLTGRRTQPDDAAPMAKGWKLRVLYEGDVGIVQSASRPLWGSTRVTIGRKHPSPAPGRRVPLADGRTSREHAQVWLEGARAFLTDLESKNGTDVNGHPLKPGVVWPLSDRDVVRLGDSFLIVRNEPVSVPDTPIDALIGVSQAACELRQAIALYAPGKVSILLIGDTGTGKGAAAAAIHGYSRTPGKFVAVNCAAVPATLAESLFFGTSSGAFSDAVERVGYFGQAHAGTLFLDEVGDLPIGIQPKLLQAVETHQATPLGSAQPVTSDVRIIAATNRDLGSAMRAGTFRADLYHRLAGAVVRSPPLRERPEDILILANHLVSHKFRPSPALVASMLAHPWPGNVRELSNVVNNVLTAGESVVIIGSLSPAGTRETAAGSQSRSAPGVQTRQAGDPPPAREEILSLLERHNGSLRSIENKCGHNRRTFRRWVEAYGIDLATYRGTDDSDPNLN